MSNHLGSTAAPISQTQGGGHSHMETSFPAHDGHHDSNRSAENSSRPAHALSNNGNSAIPSAAQLGQSPDAAPFRPSHSHSQHPRGSIHQQGHKPPQHFQNASEAQHHNFPGRSHGQEGFSSSRMHPETPVHVPNMQLHPRQGMPRPCLDQQAQHPPRPPMQRPAYGMNDSPNPAQHSRARPPRRGAQDRRKAPHQIQNGSQRARTSGAGVQQQQREPSCDSSVVCLESSEPTMASLSIENHTDGYAGQTVTSKRNELQYGSQAGTAQQSMRGGPQHKQRQARLAHHTEEHLARLLEDSRRAAAMHPSSSRSPLPAKQKRQSQNATPTKNEAGTDGLNGTGTLQASTNITWQSEEHGTCVICAEQRLASFCLHPSLLRDCLRDGSQCKRLNAMLGYSRATQTIVAVGSCNHKAVCAWCCLRMRLKYKDTHCPLCKQNQLQVIMTAWKAEGVPDWDQLHNRADTMWHKASWAKGVLVDNASSAAGSQDLFRVVQDITAYSCAVCGPKGGHASPSMKLLQQHMLREHNRHLCNICIKADNVFPLELGNFTRDELKRHEQEHPLCEFCKIRVYSGDDLFEHMRSMHFTCDVCQRNGSFVHFDNADTLVAHLRKEHHLCEEAECEYCFVAYNTSEELRQHRVQVHSRAMPRFDRSRARTMDISDAFPSHGGLPSHPRSREADDRADRRPQGRQRQNGVPSRVAAAREAAAATHEAGHIAHSQDGGMMMIDDDLGMSSAAFPDMPGTTSAPGSGHNSCAASEARRRQSGAHQEEAFPELRAQVRPTDGGSAAQEPRLPPPIRRPQPPPLQKVTLKCPCGRRVSHTAVPAGQRPGILTCDAECERQKRSNRLANAFGIQDPAHHVPWVDRQPREVQWSAELLHYAWHNKAKVQAMEAQLADFASSAQKRCSLPSMPKQERHIMHQLAQAYGMASQSFGADPARHIDIFKVSSAGLPKILLSEVAATKTLYELEVALRTEKGFSVVFTDVSPSVDLHRILSQWEGQFVLNGPFVDGEATARFTSPEAAKEVLDMLGGGVRSQYRINRAASWSSAAALGQRRPEAPAQPANPAHASRATGSNNRLPQQRLKGLAEGTAALPSREMPKRPEPAAQHRVSGPRTFHASDLAFLDPPPRTAKPRQGARTVLERPWGTADGHRSSEIDSWEDSA